MIPKVIHYCWFGGNEKDEMVQRCIESWRKYCPDYSLVEWNETNYQTDNKYFTKALEMKKWSFASDYARLDIVYQNGGVYLDTDVELIKSLDTLLQLECFVGAENNEQIASGLGFGAEAKNEMVKAMLDEYAEVDFVAPDGTVDLTPCPIRNTKAFVQKGYSPSKEITIVDGASVFPSEYFCPMNYLTREVNITENTFSIHHYGGTWMSRTSKIKRQLKKLMGPRLMKMYYRLRGIKVEN